MTINPWGSQFLEATCNPNSCFLPVWRVKKDKKDRTLEPQQAANHWSGSYLLAKYDDSAT